MNKFLGFGRRSGLLASVGVSLAVSAPAVAQNADTEDESGIASEDVAVVTTEEAEDQSSVITVTGSRIRLPSAATSKEPIVVLDQEYIEDRNLTNVADALNELPIYAGSVTPAGSQGTFGQGVNFVNTFGLGSNRTLTLINGRRFVNSNPPTVFSNASAGTQVDLNVVPTVLIDRVDIVAVGGAPVYGSDAIAGTTNVILNTRFDDIVLSGTTAITERGDNFRYNVSGVAGFNLLDDKLNITVAVSHDQVDGLLTIDRPELNQNIQPLSNSQANFNNPRSNAKRVNPNFGPDTGLTDGNPAFVQFFDTGIPFLSRGGVIFGGPLSLSRAFDSQGNLAPYDTGVVTNGIRGIGGEGFRFGDFSQITSDVRRTTGNLFVTYEFTPGIEAYVEGWYFKSRADELVQQPTFNTVLFGGASGAARFTIDNPFLTAQARGVLQNAGVTSFTLSRVNLDLADTTGFGENEVKRGVVGVRGEFEGLGRTWNVDLSYNRGENVINTYGQDINKQNFINAISVDANGKCTTDPALSTGFAAGGNPVADAACVGLNILGEGRASQAALDYVINDSLVVATLDQEVVNANIGSTLFNPWGAGDVGFNVGYEYRREAGEFIPDEFTKQGLGRAVAIAPVVGDYTLNEAFGEILFPLVSENNNIPFIKNAEVFGRARYVDNTVNGGFTSWAAGGRISPINDITIRGNFTRSFRSPAISELFSPQAGAFGFISSPCRTPNGGPVPEVRTVNCNAFNAKFPNAALIDTAADASIPILTGGNPNLQNEEANAWTIGAVFQPSFIKNFVLAVDYVNVEINNPIIFLGTADIVAGCFDNPDFDATDPANGNQFCSLIRRNPAGTRGPDPRGPNPANPTGGPIDVGGFVVNDPSNPGVNTGFANGVQFNYEAIQGVFSWNLPNFLGGKATLGFNGSALYTILRDFNNLGVQTSRSDGTFGDPTFSAQMNIRYFSREWGALVSTNFIGKQVATRDGDRTTDIREINERDPYALFNASVYFNIQDDYRVTFSVTNLLDRIYQNDYFGAPNGVADTLGRRFAVSVRTRF